MGRAVINYIDEDRVIEKIHLFDMAGFAVTPLTAEELFAETPELNFLAWDVKRVGSRIIGWFIIETFTSTALGNYTIGSFADKFRPVVMQSKLVSSGSVTEVVARDNGSLVIAGLTASTAYPGYTVYLDYAFAPVEL